MNSPAPDVDLVICTLNRPDKLETCLEHLSNVEYPNFHIVIIDSGDASHVVDRFHSLPIEYIDAPADGLPQARNRGLQHCTGDIVSFIDDDAYVQPDFLTEIVAEFDENTGAVGGPVLDPGQNFVEVEPVAEVRQNGEVVDNFDSTVRSTVDHLRGANMHYRRDVLVELGGFDGRYGGTAHFEDTDMSYRVKQAGYEVVYTPSAPVIHDHGHRGGPGYWRWRLKNWPLLFSKVDAGPVGTVSFIVRFVVRCFYFSVRARALLIFNPLVRQN